MTKIKQLFSQAFLQKLLLIYLFSQPIIDIGTSLLKHAGYDVTIGVVLRAIFLLFMGLYLLFFDRGPRRKLICAYLIALCAYVLLQNLLLLANGGAHVLFTNLKETIKVFYFPCVLIAFWALYRQFGYLLPEKPIAWIATFYALTIFISYVTGTSFQSYKDNGYCGWFYAANEISALIIILSPLVFYHYTTEKALDTLRSSTAGKRLLYAGVGVLSVLLMLFASVYLATKAALIGVAVYLICFFVWSVFRLEITHSRLARFRMLAAGLMIAALAVLYFAASPVRMNITDRMKWFHYIQVENTTVVTTPKPEETTALIPKPADDTKTYRVLNWLLSSRLNNIRSTNAQFGESGPTFWALGIGYADLPTYRYHVEVAVEMDFVSVFYRHGVVGLLLFTAPFVAILFAAIRMAFRNLKACMASLLWCTTLYQTMIGFAVGFLAGHTLVAPAVSLYEAIVLTRLYAVTSKCIEPSEESQPLPPATNPKTNPEA